MTGGQMAPTTLVDQRTTTTPYGRNAHNEGFPIQIAELISQLRAPVYVERVSLHDNKHVAKARKAVRKALKNQVDNIGFSLVEILSPCPSGWKMTPVQSMEWIEEIMEKQFPVGVFKDISKEVEPYEYPVINLTAEQIKEQLELVSDIEKKGSKQDVAERYRNPEIKVAGFGGQGVILAGVVLGEAATRAGHWAVQTQSYGPESRGGAARAEVVVSSEPIDYPRVTRADVLVALSQPGYDRFAAETAPGGLVIVDRDLVRAPEARGMPFTATAEEAGRKIVANIVMVGYLAAALDLVPHDVLAESVLRNVPESTRDLNRKALAAGRALFRDD